MKGKPSTSKAARKPMTAVERGQAAAKLMSKELRAEHKRWNLPLLSWKDGKVVATKP
jgi:chemotaxis regulatin CheY-phosphate phosphatase CheZ